MFGSRTARFGQVLAVTLAVLVLFAGMALADNLQSDLNATTTGQQKDVNRGTLSPSTAYTQDVFLFVDTQPGATNDPTYPFNVSLGSGGFGATFTGVTISGAGTGNGQTGTVGWTTPAAQATSQTYDLNVTFDAATTINESPASIKITFTIAAAPSDSTPPVIVPTVSGTLGSNGWYVSDVTVSWSVTDAQSAISSSSGCGTTIRNTDTTGTTYTCTATSAGGTASNSVTVKRDATSPSGVTVAADRAPDSNGWYTAPFTATWTGSDGTSGIDSCTQTAYSGPDTGSGSLPGSCTDKAGNTSGTVSFAFKYDATGPTVVGTPDRSADSNGWYNHAVTVTWSVVGDTSGEGTCDAPTVYSGPDSSSVTLSGNCTDGAGHSGTGTFGAFKYDGTAPTASIAADRIPDSGDWYNHSFTATTTAVGSDLSGIASCSAPQVYGGPDTASGSLSGSCVDNAGNTSSAASMSFKYDGTAPFNFVWNGGPAPGGSYIWGSVPGAPTGCSASDAISGFASCSISGYSAAVGTHIMTATAYDNAGNIGTEDRTYTVQAWTLRGFYSPVDMGGVLNTVKNGSTVPLKWEVFAGPTELTDTSVISTLQKQITCGTSLPEDTVEVTATGGTSLRYDATAGQFVFNWQTPKRPGTCWAVTMTTADGSSIQALFKLK